MLLPGERSIALDRVKASLAQRGPGSLRELTRSAAEFAAHLNNPQTVLEGRRHGPLPRVGRVSVCIFLI